MNQEYIEPQVSFLVLDFKRPESSRLCLESIRRHTKLTSYRIIYCHNGTEDYPLTFLREGLIDELIMPRENTGLGLGTRALFGACFSRYAIYWQADQIMGRDFCQYEFKALIDELDPRSSWNVGESICKSISLAGAVCGEGIFSERAFVMETDLYKELEKIFPHHGAGGAGPFHHLPWREGSVQEFYRNAGIIHRTDWPALAIDNGRDAVRENPDGSLWRHEPDRKGLWLLSGPVKEKYIYPKLSDKEWAFVLEHQKWPPGQIPENEAKDSFHVWN